MPEMPEWGRSWRLHPLVQLTLVRYREFIREPEAMFWVFIFPILMAAGLGIAFRNKPAEVSKIAVLTTAHQADSVVARLRRDSSVVVQSVTDSGGAENLRTGKVALLVIPRGGDSVEYRYDDTRPEARSARQLVDDVLQRGAGRKNPVGTRETLVREPGSRYIDFLVPGLLGMNLMSSSLWGLGFALVDQRRKKLLKRLLATPMAKTHYLASFLLSRLTLLFMEVLILVGFGVLAFGVPMRGSLLVFATICLLSTLAFGGLGLLVAARPKTVEAASGLMNLVMLPMWVFSGVFFSSSNFPKVAQPFIQALPLTAANNALRANMLEGAGFAAVAPELGILALWLLIAFPIALKIFRWR